MSRAVFSILTALALAACLKAPPVGPAPHQIHIVGASAALPFSSAAAERLMREQSDSIAPLVQADGSTDAISRFCAGLGRLHPDLAATARPMAPTERSDCAGHGVAHVAQIPFGWTATVLIARPDTVLIGLTKQQIAGALAGSVTLWKQIDPALPALPIVLIGPAPRRVSDDGLFDLVERIRTDGAYRGQGSDAALVVRKVVDTPGAIGIVPYAYAAQAGTALRLLTVDGIPPTPASIASGRYPWHRPLILFIKTGEASAVPHLPALIGYYREGWAAGGAFEQLGLVPLDAAGRARADALAKASSGP